jgi:hypothetical protein
MDHMELTIADLQAKVREMERAAADIKATINKLCALSGRPAMYADTSLSADTGQGELRKDRYYGKPLSTAVRMYLEGRENLGAATLEEIFAALLEGGFKFAGKDEENAKRGLAISLSKNAKVFHHLPSGAWGLSDWYPGVKQAKQEGESNGEKALGSTATGAKAPAETPDANKKKEAASGN